MPTRTLTATTTGPVYLSTVLIGAPGHIAAHVDPTCTRATVTVTADTDTGPAANAVHSATLSPGYKHPHTLIVEVFGKSGVDHHPVNETNTVAISTGRPTGQPIRIHAVLPPGSRVQADTQNANVRVDGHAAAVRVSTDKGTVTINHADSVHARTSSGAVTIGHATQIDTHTSSGPVNIGTTEAATIKTHAGHVTINNSQGNTQVNTYDGVVTLHLTRLGVTSVMTSAANINITATPDVIAAVPADFVAGRRHVRLSTGEGRISVPDQWRRLVLPHFRAA